MSNTTTPRPSSSWCGRDRGGPLPRANSAFNRCLRSPASGNPISITPASSWRKHERAGTTAAAGRLIQLLSLLTDGGRGSLGVCQRKFQPPPRTSSALNGVYSSESDTGVLSNNAARLTGPREEHVPGRPCHEFFPLNAEGTSWSMMANCRRILTAPQHQG